MQVVNTLEQFNMMLPILRDATQLGFDLETTGLDPKHGSILLMQLSTRTETYVIDFTVLPVALSTQLKPILSKTLLVGANITFDYRWLYWHTGIKALHITDVMVNEQVLTAGLFIPSHGKSTPFTLAAIAYRRLGIELDKSVRDEFINYTGTLTEQAYEYAASDVAILHDIYDQQLTETKKHALERIHELENRLLPVTAHMELAGVLIDREKLQALEAPMQRYVDTCYRMLQDLIIGNGGADRIVCGDTYHAVSVNSKPQMLAAFNALGIDVDSLDIKALTRWDLRKNKDTLQQLENMLQQDESDILTAIEQFGGYNNPYLRAYAFYVGAEKLLGTYVKGLQKKIKPDGKFYPWFRQCGARATGRYSSDAQQIPQNSKLDRLGLKGLSIRECIIAPKGSKFIIADYSAIELVILADRSGDERLAYEILHGDVHTVVTKEVMGQFWPIALEITDKNKGKGLFKLLRDFSKTLSYGIAYGVTGKSLAEQASAKLASANLTFTSDQGDQAVLYWKQTFKQAGVFLDTSGIMALTKGYTDSVWGRKRWYDLDYINQNKWRQFATKREGSNQRIQSTSADMTKQAMVYIHNMLDSRYAHIVLSIHDEIVLQSQDEYADQASAIVKHGMELAARDMLPTLGNVVIVNPAISQRYDK